MLKIVEASRYTTCYRECIIKYGEDISELDRVVYILASGHKLHKKYKDHSLNRYKEFKGKGMRDCHIATVDDDWILIYMLKKKNLILLYTGSHHNFFKYEN